MGAEAILDKIRKNAEEETAALRRQGEERAAAAAEKIRTDAEAEADLLLLNALRTIEEMERREMLTAGLEARKNTLAARRAVIDEAFAEAGSRLSKLPEDRWEALITRLVLFVIRWFALLYCWVVRNAALIEAGLRAASTSPF